MADIACFTRNRCTTVERVDEQTMRSTCRVQDTFMEAWVEILVKSPNLDITAAAGEIRRSGEGARTDISEDIRKVIGARVGPGIRKIIRGLIGEKPFVETLSVLLDECCNGVIMSFTRDVLLSAPKDPAGEKTFFSDMVRANPRLYNSCAALSGDSPLMEALEPVKSERSR
jgi:hypothetical protein